MSKLPLSLGAAAVALAALLTPAAPADAQAKRGEIIVYGTDPCPRSTDDEVVVCSRRPAEERFRIPQDLRQGGSIQSRQAWVERSKALRTVGNVGTGSCSAVGPGGFTGCVEQTIRDAFKDRDAQAEGDTPPTP
jgi:hypothetical protein